MHTDHTYLHSAAVRLDVNHVAHGDFLLLQRLVDARLELQHLGALCALQTDADVCDGLSVAAKGILGLLGRDLGDLAFVDLFDFLDAQALRKIEG